MKRVIFVLSLFCVFSFAILNDGYAQRQRPTPVMESKWIAGGNFGFGITNSSLYFSVAPQLGYRITPRWELGVRASYELNYYYDYYYGNQTCNLFGGSVYTNYQIFRGIFVHFEDELLYQMPIYNHQVVENDARWYNNLFAGVGYRQHISSKAYLFLLAMYNINYSLGPYGQFETPYTPFVFRWGFCVGL